MIDKAPPKYLGRPLEPRKDRYLRYCSWFGDRAHKEEPLHLVRCSDVIDEERQGWMKILLQQGVLSLEGGWFLLGAGIFCNPRYFSSPTYFVNRADANTYLRDHYKYSRTQYEVRVCEAPV